jgi:hypothetical protein
MSSWQSSPQGIISLRIAWGGGAVGSVAGCPPSRKGLDADLVCAGNPAPMEWNETRA